MLKRASGPYVTRVCFALNGNQIPHAVHAQFIFRLLATRHPEDTNH